MIFTSIDLQSWPRRQVFYYFSKMAPTGYSMTVKLDVTALWKTTHQKGVKFFPAYLWLVTKNLNRQVEFKVAEKDGVLGYYNELTPLYASFHEDDHTFSLMWVPYSEQFSDFNRQYLENQRLYRDHHGVLAVPHTPPDNAYTVSCVPWIGFEHFAVHSYENKLYYFPSVEAGKVIERDGRFWMPLSLTCHHATTDGWHISRFLEDLKSDMVHFECYL
ncbi:CatA-like O-acetyltransferase [Caproiciproducens faecalis]|uniref:Chloramphenicol acetyltransferase CAT n=1 Tax=Caproiciproducens faecalis TaxID=2820301 RepID=A0ABS7DM41_9FIRM|nr:CatA-like O-acetyltransferase [Caproiciproducens faecalis]MBW7571895.1 chloramphenicol acetyltransferase CAT [Caproiciproducens faecalis]